MDSSNEVRKTPPVRQRRPNYGKIHAKPLPLDIYPLPIFLPHNPLSLLWIGYTLLSHFWSRPSSHVPAPYKGCFSPETRSIHVTDEAAIRALWEHGFFGKGTLSRSEPTWLDQERKRRGLVEGLTSEEHTEQRRRERIEMKRERARKQREILESQLTEEVKDGDAVLQSTEPNSTESQQPVTEEPASENAADEIDEMLPNYSLSGTNVKQYVAAQTDVTNEEHLQLSFEEAFFLTYGLGVLAIEVPDRPAGTMSQLLTLFRRYSYFPPATPDALRTDDAFLVNYVVYHHFRSLGWVVRPGNKFAVDFLLYKGGPVFAHAEFALIIVPSYVHSYWFQTEERKEGVKLMRRRLDWWWLHSVHRIQNQVFKTLVLVYVEIPPPTGDQDTAIVGVGELLSGYRVREIVLKRWTPNRSRD
ncbi:hypothetical protein NA57DRAFT_43935 [Rhizodiscina lignyota]|uniref:tRNA-splicing endonuclease subunit Sen2 n=1 Tax=Rhizodiscina lignyota TaxID=1504668 RepID=A0A9P4ICM1_9PEZI|nr:hypothetical protein NA57DRAFT_43935 [Rhizodiscina lignyota]